MKTVLEFIENWKSFWGRPDLLKRGGIHPSGWCCSLEILQIVLELKDELGLRSGGRQTN